jgi:hypothetical protein
MSKSHHVAANKAACETYRKTGRREANKRLKALRHAKRVAFFAARRLSGVVGANRLVRRIMTGKVVM